MSLLPLAFAIPAGWKANVETILRSANLPQKCFFNGGLEPSPSLEPFFVAQEYNCYRYASHVYILASHEHECTEIYYKRHLVFFCPNWQGQLNFSSVGIQIGGFPQHSRSATCINFHVSFQLTASPQRSLYVSSYQILCYRDHNLWA